MYYLRVPVFLLAALVLLRCIAAAPSHRYFSPSSSDDEQENALPVKESRSLPRLISEPFPGLRGPQRRFAFPSVTSLRLKKKKKEIAEKLAKLRKGQKIPQ